MKSLSSVVILALAATALLFLVGDFTPYAGDADRDVWVSPPGLALQLLLAAAVAVPFAAFSLLLFAAMGRLVPGARPLRLGLALVPGFCAVVYCFGPFKELFGDPPPNLVHYELPWGAVRLFVSAACAASASVLVALGIWVWHATLSGAWVAGQQGPPPE